MIKEPLGELLESTKGDDTGAALAEALLDYYGLALSDDGVVRMPGIDTIKFLNNMSDLLNDSLFYAGMTIATGALRFGENGGFQPHHLDDSGDYDNAASDQIRWILDTFQEYYEGMGIVDRVLQLLNCSTDDLDDCGLMGVHAHGFLLGYADHFTPISHLMLANNED